MKWTQLFDKNEAAFSNASYDWEYMTKAERADTVARCRRRFREFSRSHGGGNTPYMLSQESAKLQHNATSEHATTWVQRVMYLSPATESGNNWCLDSTAGCRASCLWHGGRLGMSAGQTASYVRSKFWAEQPYAACFVLFAEIEAAEKRAKKLGVRLAIRLNGTSDADWHGWLPLHDLFPSVQFTEYTKDERRVWRDMDAIGRYNILSATERTTEDDVRNLPLTINVAIVFKGVLPKEFAGRPVIDGDAHDFRFLDPQGVVVGLVAKGKARRDKTGFARQPIAIAHPVEFMRAVGVKVD